MKRMEDEEEEENGKRWRRAWKSLWRQMFCLELRLLNHAKAF